MPTETDNDTEALLKAYAEKRREAAGEPLGLHPANRKLLQDEVRRMYGKSQAPSKPWKFIEEAKPAGNSLATKEPAPTAPTVLDRFEIESTTEGIVFRDADGSVYRGAWVAREERSNPGAERLKFSFLATGTNLTTQLPVAFRGQLGWLPSSSEAARPDAAPTNSPRLNFGNASTSPMEEGEVAGTWWIQGAVQVGKETERTVKARYQAR